jgi:hypothetical protein
VVWMGAGESGKGWIGGDPEKDLRLLLNGVLGLGFVRWVCLVGVGCHWDLLCLVVGFGLVLGLRA